MDFSRPDKFIDQLGVMDDLVVASESWILIL